MKPTHTQRRGALQGTMTLVGAGMLLAACSKQEAQAPTAGSTPPIAAPAPKRVVEIRAKGSDTMIQLATGWAEAYRKVNPGVMVNANGGGSGTGIAALQNGTTDLCNASREIKPEERAKVKATTGKDVQEFVVAYDALAVYSNPSNPVKEISIDELREIWAEGGGITSWDHGSAASLTAASLTAASLTAASLIKASPTAASRSLNC